MSTPPPVLFEEFEDMIAEMNEAGVEFLVVGGFAVAAHGVVRATLDIDFFVRPTPENATRMMQALLAWGAPVEVHGVSAKDFAKAGTVYQIGLPPRRIDILTAIDGVSYEDACREKLIVKLNHLEFAVIGREALIKNKYTTGRHKDLGDIDELNRGRNE